VRKPCGKPRRKLEDKLQWIFTGNGKKWLWIAQIGLEGWNLD
jgi:hypothetical protein